MKRICVKVSEKRNGLVKRLGQHSSTALGRGGTKRVQIMVDARVAEGRRYVEQFGVLVGRKGVRTRVAKTGCRTTLLLARTDTRPKLKDECQRPNKDAWKTSSCRAVP